MIRSPLGLGGRLAFLSSTRAESGRWDNQGCAGSSGNISRGVIKQERRRRIAVFALTEKGKEGRCEVRK